MTMELPGWVKDPYIFLRYLLPGFLFLGFSAAFFPRVLDGATRALTLAPSRSDLILFVWFSWALAIGLVSHAFYRVLYDTFLRPRPRHEVVVARTLAASMVPPPQLSSLELRTLYALAAGHFRDLSAQGWARREANLIHASYQTLIVLVFTGFFMMAMRPTGPLVSANWPEAQGAVFVVAGVTLGFVAVWRRDAYVQRAEIASIPWDGPEARALLVGWCLTLLRARGDQEVPSAAGPPPVLPPAR